MAGGACVIVTAVAACGSSSGGGGSSSSSSSSTALEPVSLTVAYSAPIAAFAPLYVLNDNPDLCSAEKLTVTAQYLQVNPAVQALIAGSVPLLVEATSTYLISAEKSPTSQVAVGLTGPIANNFYGVSSVQSLSDLKGKTVAATVAGTLGDLVAREVMKEAGMFSPPDYQMLYSGNAAALVSQAQTGAVSAFGYSPPLPAAASEHGIHLVKDLSNDNNVIPVLSLAIAANRSYYDQNQGVVGRFLSCLVKADKYATTNATGTAASIAKALRVSDTVAQQGYQVNQPAFKLTAFSDSAVKDVLDALKLAGQTVTVNNKQVIDNHLAEAALAKK